MHHSQSLRPRCVPLISGSAQALAVCLCLIATGCGPGIDQRATITETRDIPAPSKPSDPTLTAEQRLGARRQTMSVGDSDAAPGATAAPAFAWDAPAEWTPQPPTQFRLANFTIGETECYLSVLPGTAGGVKENLDRWRSQMSQPPYTDDEFAALPRTQALGSEAVWAEIDGVYTGMSGQTSNPEYTMLGMVVPHAGNTVFVKMVGPREAVSAERQRLGAFCASLRAVETEASATQDSALPAGHPPIGDGSAAVSETSPVMETGPSLSMDWTVPEGWQRKPDQPMRLATFSIGAESSAECVVSVWDGAMGGEAANVNMWRSQFGVGDLDDASVAALPRVEMLGANAAIVELPVGGQSGPKGAPALIGAICMLPEHSVFAKMTGPGPEVAAQREAFLAFCRSMRLKE